MTWKLLMFLLMVSLTLIIIMSYFYTQKNMINSMGDTGLTVDCMKKPSPQDVASKSHLHSQTSRWKSICPEEFARNSFGQNGNVTIYRKIAQCISSS